MNFDDNFCYMSKWLLHVYMTESVLRNWIAYPLCLSLGRVRPPFDWNNFVGTQPHFSIESKVPEKSNMPPAPKPIKQAPKLTQAKPKIAPKINRKGAQALCPELPWLPTATSFFWILLCIVVVGICTGVSTLRVWSHYRIHLQQLPFPIYFLWETHKNRHVQMWDCTHVVKLLTLAPRRWRAPIVPTGVLGSLKIFWGPNPIS